VGKEQGKIQLKWSRIQRRFNGTWSEGDECFGELSIRLAEHEIRGARTTDPKSKIDPATPRLADFVWIRVGTMSNTADAARAKTTFGPVTKGLQAAVELDPGSGGFTLGQPIKVRFHIRNASDKSIYLAGGSWRQDSTIKIEDEQGRQVPARYVWSSGETLILRNLLEPGDSTRFHSSGLAFIAEGAGDKRVSGPVCNYVEVKPGRYTIRYRLHFPDVSEGRPGGPPRNPEDWQGDLETAPVTVDVAPAEALKPAEPQPAPADMPKPGEPQPAPAKAPKQSQPQPAPAEAPKPAEPQPAPADMPKPGEPQAAPAEAAPATTPKPGGRAVTGKVVDASGKAAVGAKIWLYMTQLEGTSPVLDETTTDEQGRFRFTGVKRDGGSDGAEPAILARDTQGRLGPAPSLWGRRFEESETEIPIELGSESEIPIELGEVKPYEARVVDDTGKPIAKLRLRPVYVNVPPEASGASLRKPGVIGQWFFPRDLADEIQTETASDGRFTLRGVPTRGQIKLRTAGGGFVSCDAVCDLETPATIRLARPGALCGQLLGAKRTGTGAGTRLSIASAADEREPQPDSPRADALVWFHTEVSAGADGEFGCNEVPAGRYTVWLHEDNMPYYLGESPPIEVRSGQTSSVTIALLPAIAVRGRVVDQQTKQSVPGVRVNLFMTSPPTITWSRVTTTDHEGRFLTYGKPGQANLRLTNIPEEYGAENCRSRALALEITRETELPPIELPRRGTLQGMVVDPTINNRRVEELLEPPPKDNDGKPVPADPFGEEKL
jgi:5-hydroxyisourate hydrolase-like protein (transthyretin family)